MEIIPILSALKRNKVGAFLIALQVALTLAIVCNALFIIREHLSYLARPTGLLESDLVVLTNQWAGDPSNPPSQYAADLTVLRSLQDVVDASFSNSMPLSTASAEWGQWKSWVQLKPDAGSSKYRSAVYGVDEHMLTTWGLNLVAGRNFKPQEILDVTMTDTDLNPSVIIISRALAQQLFPGESAIGKTVSLDADPRLVTIIGVVERLQTSWAWNWSDRIIGEYSLLLPYRLHFTQSYYFVRAKPGMADSVMWAAEKKLFENNPARVITSRLYTDVRAKAYRREYALAGLLSMISFVLVIITAFGIVGLASFWVTQRRKHIGTRRALGATRMAILRYFLLENLMISLGGVSLGVLLSYGLNLWLVVHYEMNPLPWMYVLTGSILVLLLGQVAVLSPARRAASIPPAIATRTA